MELIEMLRSLKIIAPLKEKTFNEISEIDIKNIFKNACLEWSARTKKKFVIDNENIEEINIMLLYIFGHKEFEKSTLIKNKADINKGIILCGNVGSGKTLLFTILNNMLHASQKIMIVPCDTVTDMVRKDGVAALEKYTKLYHNEKRAEILFDDLGIENKAKYYGDTINPMYDLIIKRYRLFTDFGLKTHFTTNLKPEEWEQYYDVRTASRLNEMCNIIVLGGKQTSKDRRCQ